LSGAFLHRPPACIATAIFLAGLGTSVVARRRSAHRRAFLGSAAFLLGILAATVACLYPVLLKSSLDSAASLTAWNAASAPHALSLALCWWPAGLVLAGLYTAFLFRMHRGKAGATPDGDGY
jgi:cytochrome d ubiquinol oxidase subunit II